MTQLLSCATLLLASIAAPHQGVAGIKRRRGRVRAVVHTRQQDGAD